MPDPSTSLGAGAASGLGSILGLHKHHHHGGTPMKALPIGVWMLCMAVPAWSQAASHSQAQVRKSPSLLPHTCKVEDYPAGAKLRNAQGTTRVQLTVTIAGEVKDVTVIKSSGHADLDAATVRLFSSCRATPGEKEGRPAEGTLEFENVWKLD